MTTNVIRQFNNLMKSYHGYFSHYRDFLYSVERNSLLPTLHLLDKYIQVEISYIDTKYMKYIPAPTATQYTPPPPVSTPYYVC